MDDTTVFGPLLRTARKAHELTQATLAAQAACSTDSIKKIEAGTRRPSRHLAVRFADCLALTGAERARFLAVARSGAPGAARRAADPPGRKTGSAAPGTRHDLRAAPPTARPPSSLPPQVTSFIGRVQEIGLVKSLLQSVPARLVTLTGAGGCGKTRLALQVASGLAADSAYPDGVCWVELAALFDPLLVPQVVASALGMPAPQRSQAIEPLVDYLRSRRLLLVLDNCEHLLEACVALVADLLPACPGIRVLATSREALNVAGENSYVVPSLRLPDTAIGRGASSGLGAASAAAPADLGSLEQTEAVSLFVERAKAARPGFALTAQNAGAVVQICRSVDGIPLALELAAARVKLLRAEEIAAYLDNSFGLLTGGRRGAPPRHQTLKGAIDWSHNLLTHDERVLFRRLAVFVGGFTVAAAQAVCAGEGLPQERVFDLLARLVDKSLVSVAQDYQPTRYRLLEPLRQYAREKLRAAREGEEAAALGYAHARYFLALTEQGGPELWGAAAAAWLGRLQAEQDNLRAAVQWAVQQQDAALGARLAQALHWFWYLSGVSSEGRRSVAGILAIAGVAGGAEERASALWLAGYLALLDGDRPATARAPLEESVAIYRGLGDQHGLAVSLQALGRALLFAGEAPAARKMSEESSALFRELGDAAGLARALTYLMIEAMAQADYASGHAFGEEALAIYQAAGNQWGAGIVLNQLGDLARCRGDYRQAEDLYTRSRRLFTAAGVQADTASILHNLGYVALAGGDCTRARALFTESLTLQRERANRAGILEALAGFGALLAAQGQARQGAVVTGAVAALRSSLGVPIWPAERVEGARQLAKMRAALGEEALRAALAEGEGLPLEQAITYAADSLEPTRPATSQAIPAAWHGLTPREREVVALISQGKSNRAIADALVITERTVETHTNHIRSRLGLTSRTQIALWAVARGLPSTGG